MMANASKKHVGAGAKGKGDGSGAMHITPDGVLGENDVLSNRDKSLHTQDRGQDSKWVQTEQRNDHAGNRLVTASADDVDRGSASGPPTPGR